MQKKFLLLYEDFLTINKMKWIKSLRGGSTGVGYTFESLLNKKEDRICAPDYLNIEIKTMRYFSKKKIHLFNSTPNAKDSASIKEIVSILGYPHRQYPQFKVFNVSITADKYTHIGYKNLKLKVNHKEKRIELVNITDYGKTININVFWSFDVLKDVLYSKLHHLAIVKAYSKKNNETEYFYYSNISFYILKDFNTFISLIEKGIIRINFKIGIYTDSNRFGKICDHGTDFSIMEKDINLLFDEVKIYK